MIKKGKSQIQPVQEIELLDLVVQSISVTLALPEDKIEALQIHWEKLIDNSQTTVTELALMFHQIFLSPQVKRCVIITYKYGIYELIAERLKTYRKVSKPGVQSPCQNASFVNTSKKVLKNRNKTFPVMLHSTRKPEPAPNIPQITAATWENPTRPPSPEAFTATSISRPDGIPPHKSIATL